ncbi:MAG: DegT/DnrJ/EryC1/StrS family aminotransferase [Acidobacteriota bacterium]|nr:DegT/DnrJ/EryC1/StrS family aminotransferase [Acidobacteriota bacterium]
MDRKYGREQLAINGGKPVRTEPLPLEFPGIHHMGEEEVEAATRVLKSRSLFRFYGVDLQNEVASFEDEFAGQLGVPHAVAVTSGTGALSVALSALGAGPEQEVIIPAYMWVSVAAAVVNRGAIPVLADIDDTFCLDPQAVEAAITPKTAGIILVHMSGAPGDVKAVREIASRHGIFLLEDCAQCNGGSVDGRKVGTFGDIATFSFQMNKNMTSGEGGCVATSDRQLYRRAVACHDLGYARDEKGRLVFDDPGCCLWGEGYRMDELRGAILRVQLKKLPYIIERMRASKYRIRKAIETLPRVRLRKVIDPAGDTGCFLITTYPDPETAKEVNQALLAEGIVTHPQGLTNVVMTEWGLHLYYNIPSLVKKTSVADSGFPWRLVENAGLERRYDKGTCPVADSLFERSIILAVPSCLTKQDEDDIIQAFEKVHRAIQA